VVGFESSSALAAAYGVAVTGTMLITTLLASAVVLLLWKTPRWLAIPLLLGFLLVDSLFFAANVPKILQGGAFPVIAGVALFVLMTTWKRGRRLIVERLDEGALPLTCSSASLRTAAPPGQGHGGVPHRSPTPCRTRCCTTCCTTRCCTSRWCC
jgi:KUP system potassium uptake protein